uniref:Uncharacterized protein n=1 Tax=Ailuropoda melanoleuca TaxID=9646 RepID=A0A7N5KJR9_AILME
MPRARQRSDDESSSPSRGGSAVGPQEPAAPKPDEHEEGKLSATLREKTTKLFRRTGARRTQEEVAEANLDPPSNYTNVSASLVSVCNERLSFTLRSSGST